MYGTQSLNGSPAIERNGQVVLHVCDKDWDFATWLCALLNQLTRMPRSLLTERDMESLKAMDQVLERQVQNA